MSRKQLKLNREKKFRICVMGPAYVGKTQVINRIINNSFTPYYEPTKKEQTYRCALNINEDEPQVKPQFADLELIDMFPHDHPLLFLNQGTDLGEQSPEEHSEC